MILIFNLEFCQVLLSHQVLPSPKLAKFLLSLSLTTLVWSNVVRHVEGLWVCWVNTEMNNQWKLVVKLSYKWNLPKPVEPDSNLLDLLKPDKTRPLSKGGSHMELTWRKGQNVFFGGRNMSRNTSKETLKAYNPKTRCISLIWSFYLHWFEFSVGLWTLDIFSVCCVILVWGSVEVLITLVFFGWRPNRRWRVEISTC